MKNHTNYILCALCALGVACADEPKDMNPPDMGGDLTSPVDETQDMPDEGVDLPDETPDVPPDIEPDETPDMCVPDVECPDDFCGKIDDGCGMMLTCGGAPKTCADQGPGACGMYPDECGGQLGCGTCLCDVRGGRPEVPIEPTCGPCGLGRSACSPEGVPSCELPTFTGSDAFFEGLASRCQDILYVDTAAGGVGAPGTKEQPMKTLEAALGQTSRPVIVFHGDAVLPSTMTVSPGQSILGGYDTDLVYEPNTRSRVRYTLQSPNNKYGARASGIQQTTVVSNVRIIAPDARAGEASVGMYIENSPGLVLHKVQVEAGAGGDGENGIAGSPGSAGVDGTSGSPGFAYANRWTFPTCAQIPQCVAQMTGRGASNPSCVSGTRGGDGGKGGFAETLAPEAGTMSVAGVAGGISGPSVGGSGARSTDFPTPGTPGMGGDALAGRIQGGVWTPLAASHGRDGGDGAHGKGGGGGSGGPIGPSDQSGPSGSGGGSGGCGGTGATGGTAGYASIGVMVLGSTGLEIVDSSFTADKGGVGGRGAFGGMGGTGGKGGAPFTQGWSSSAQSALVNLPNHGGAGGDGTSGGLGGPSGGGAGGPSIGVWCESSTLEVDSITIFKAGEPGDGGGAQRTASPGALGVAKVREQNACNL